MNRIKNLLPATSFGRGLLLSQLAALGGSVFFLAYQRGCDGIEPVLGAYSVFIFAFLFGLLPVWKSLPQVRQTRWEKKYLLMLALISLSALIGNVSAAAALKSLPPASVHLLQRSETVFAILIGVCFLQERGIRVFLVSMLLFCLGIFFLYLHEHRHTQQPISYMPFLFGVISGGAFAVMQAASRVLLQKINAVLINSLRLLVLLLTMTLIAPDLITRMLSLPQDNLFFLFLSAFAGPFLGRLCYMNAGALIGVARAALFVSAAPVFTLVLQVLILGLAVSALQLTGSLILLVAVSVPIISHYISVRRQKLIVLSDGL